LRKEVAFSFVKAMLIEQPVNILHPSYGATCENQAFSHPAHIATRELPFLQGFYKGKCNFFSQEKFFSFLSSGIQAIDPSEGNR
jgi:hypothetical protein